MAAIEQIIGCTAAKLVGSGRLLTLGEQPIAVLSEPSTTGALVAHVGEVTNLPTLLGMLTSIRPSGIVLVSSSRAECSLAIELDEGRVVGAVGPRALERMGAWVVELHRRYDEVRGATGPSDDAAVVRALRPGRVFLRESVLRALATCDHVGSRLLLLEGEVQWLDQRLEPEDTADFGFLLMELARRNDELGALEAALLEEGGIPMPVSRPPVQSPAPPDDDGWEVEDAAGWLDARFVFPFCNGVLDVEAIVERTLLGRFRTLAALHALAEQGHVRLVKAERVGEDANSDEFADLIASLV